MCKFFSVQSFGQTTFQKFISNPNSNVGDFIYDATIDTDKYLYFIGENDLQQTEIIKIDSLGNVLWNKSPSSLIFSADKILYSQDSQLILGGISLNASTNTRYTTLVKCDTSGNVIWSSYTPGLFSGFARHLALAEDPDSNYISFGYNYLFDSTLNANKKIPFYHVYNSNGTLLYYRIIIDSNPNNSMEINDVVWHKDLGLMGIGTSEDLTTNKRKFLLIQLDSVYGVKKIFLSSNTNGNEFAYNIIADGDYIIISGSRQVGATLHPFFIRLDDQLNIITSNYLTSNLSYGATSIVKYLNQSYIVTGNGPMVMLLDSSLSLINHFNYGPSSFNRYLVKAIAEDNGFVYLFGRNGITPNKLVIRTDTTFNSGCYSYQTISFSQFNLSFQFDTVGFNVVDTATLILHFDTLINHGWNEVTLCISSSSENIDLINTEIICFPNPAKERLNILITESYNYKNARVYIYDVLGRNVFYTLINTHDNLITLDISKLIPGVYSVVCDFREKGAFIKKFVKN